MIDTTMDSANDDVPTLPTVTAAAAREVARLIAAGGHPETMLRVTISGGGCSGFRYDFALDDARAGDDVVVACDAARVVIDPLSLEYLAGAEIDFVDELAGSKFVLRRLNAHHTCGCGSSFSM